MTRLDFASHVDRSAIASEYLRKHGNAIQMYWLSDYIFFPDHQKACSNASGAISRRLVRSESRI